MYLVLWKRSVTLFLLYCFRLGGGTSGSITGGFLSPNGIRTSPKETMGVCIWMWTGNGRQHHVQTTIIPSAKGHQVCQLDCTIIQMVNTNSKFCLLYRRSSHWASSAPRELSRINQAKNLDTFQRILLLFSQLSHRQLGPCFSWLSKNGYTDFTLLLSFYMIAFILIT